MADFTESKKFGTKTYPVEAFATSDLMRRCEPLLTPDLLLSRYLKSQEKEIRSKYSEEELKQKIELAMNEFELMTGLAVTKIQDMQRIPFDRDLYRAFVYIKTNHGPIQSVEEIQIQSSNGENIYNLPADWIEVGLAHKRQLNLVPILSIFGAAGLQDGKASNAGLIFLQAINNFHWLPAFFTVKYTHGLCDKEGSLPIPVNEAIGMTAAIAILSDLQSGNKYTSTSVGQDGLSQAASSAGPQIYVKRIEDLEAKKAKILAKLKAIFSNKYFLSNI
jgi:hypothetical protein